MKANKSNLTKILALGTTCAALLSGVLVSNVNQVDATSSTTFLRLKRNSYEYTRSGKRANKRVDTKGSSFYAKGNPVKIKGKKYYRLKTKRHVYIKASNLKVRLLTDQVTIKHN